LSNSRLKSEFVCAQHYVCAALLCINSSVMVLLLVQAIR